MKKCEHSTIKKPTAQQPRKCGDNFKLLMIYYFLILSIYVLTTFLDDKIDNGLIYTAFRTAICRVEKYAK